MYSKTTKLPPIGSHMDRILVERFFRERQLTREKYEILFITAAKLLAQKMDQDGIKDFSRLVDGISGARWFNEGAGVQEDKKKSDLEMLERVKAMSVK